MSRPPIAEIRCVLTPGLPVTGEESGPARRGFEDQSGESCRPGQSDDPCRSPSTLLISASATETGLSLLHVLVEPDGEQLPLPAAHVLAPAPRGPGTNDRLPCGDLLVEISHRLSCRTVPERLLLLDRHQVRPHPRREVLDFSEDLDELLARFGPSPQLSRAEWSKAATTAGDQIRNETLPEPAKPGSHPVRRLRWGQKKQSAPPRRISRSSLPAHCDCTGSTPHACPLRTNAAAGRLAQPPRAGTLSLDPHRTDFSS